MKRQVAILICILYIIGAYAQKIDNNVLQLSIKDIQFIKLDADTTTVKPVILFCQGSLPIPLVIKDQVGIFIPAIDNFDYKSLVKDFHIVIIAMPGTPVFADVSKLNNIYEFVPDTSKPTEYAKEYLDGDFLEKYSERGNCVIDFLQNAKWALKDKIIVIGHSQGARVAAELARHNEDIFAVGYFSGTVLGRYAKQITEQRQNELKGIITSQQAQENITELYQQWRKICNGESYGNSARTWTSFSSPDIESLTALKMPLYIAYGTKDAGAQQCDLLPIYLDLAKKNNYVIRPFVDCGHNFEEIDSDGKPNYEKMHWN